MFSGMISLIDREEEMREAAMAAPGRFRARFFCINDDVPEETARVLREACEARGVEYHEIDARRFDYAPARRLAAGDLLYRPATSVAAMRAEQFLLDRGVATFYAEEDGAFFDCTNSTLRFERAGLPIPPTVYCSTTDRATLRAYVERLGGFPVVIKAPGGEGGVGVMRADSFPALFSIVDYAVSLGAHPLLCAYLANAVHWRLVVIGDRVAASYRNITAAEDFRTFAGEDLEDYRAPIAPEMAEIAVGAVRALRYEFGGVDLLQTPDGRNWLLEANFPCYFPQAQLVAGIDLSGMMIDHLLAKAERLAAREARGDERERAA